MGVVKLCGSPRPHSRLAIQSWNLLPLSFPELRCQQDIVQNLKSVVSCFPVTSYILPVDDTSESIMRAVSYTLLSGTSEMLPVLLYCLGWAGCCKCLHIVWDDQHVVNVFILSGYQHVTNALKLFGASVENFFILSGMSRCCKFLHIVWDECCKSLHIVWDECCKFLHIVWEDCCKFLHIVWDEKIVADFFILSGTTRVLEIASYCLERTSVINFVNDNCAAIESWTVVVRHL